MNHVPGAGSIARPFHRQTSVTLSSIIVITHYHGACPRIWIKVQCKGMNETPLKVGQSH